MASSVTIRWSFFVTTIVCAVITGYTVAIDEVYEPEVGYIGTHPDDCYSGHEKDLIPEECDKDLGHGTDEKGHDEGEEDPEHGIGNGLGHDHDEGEEDPEHGTGEEGLGHGHDHDHDEGANGGDDAPHIVSNALLCLNEKHIYNECEESFRLTLSGELHVPHDHVDEFCGGPCLEETNLVLNCIDEIMDHFIFYNKATTHDVRDTILTGCGHGETRGDFDVAEHIEADEGDESISCKGATRAVFGIVVTLLGHILLF